MTALIKAPLVWSDDREDVLVHVDSLRVTEADSWLLCDLELEPMPARRRRVRFAFHGSVNDTGDRVLAAATIDGPRRHGARLAQRCAADIEAVLWSVLR
jgi:hypothetical protein